MTGEVPGFDSGYRLSPSAEEWALIEGFRRYAGDVLRPRCAMQGEVLFSRSAMTEIFGELSNFGFVTGPIPEARGGLGLKWTTCALLMEELSRVSGALGIAALIQTIVAALLARSDPGVTDRYLAGLLTGERIGVIAISEPDVGSNVVEARCRAEPAEGGYRISGEKTWISNGEHSDFAVCVARSGPEASDLGLFLVDREKHGYDASGIAKLGLKQTSTAQLFLDGATIPADHRLTAPGEGLRGVMTVFEVARPLVGITGVGIAAEALDRSIAYSVERRQHGKPIAGHQLIQAKLADMATEIDAARLLVLRAFDLIDRGERAEIASAMAKYYATEMAARVTSHAVQIHGGNGITAEFGIEALFRDARMLTIPDGTTEIQKLIIGRGLTGVRAF